jgi:2'-5' RNA ligase
METRRLFFAFWPQPAWQAALAQSTRGAGEWLGATRVPPGNLHITLVFVGSVAEPEIARLEHIAGTVVAQLGAEPARVALDVLDYWKQPRVICLTTDQPADAQAARIAELLRDRLVEAGFTPDLRPWRPHVTLARKVSRGGSLGTVEPVEWTFRELALVESQAGPTGSIYRCRSRFAWLIPWLVILAGSLGSTGARGASHQGGHADDRIHCRSDTGNAAVVACSNIIDDERLEEFERAAALKNRAYHYQELGDVDRAIDDYTKVLSRPEQRRIQAKTYLNRGLMYSKKGAAAAALADFTTAATLDPKLDSAYLNRASILMSQGDADGAIADLDRALQLDPQSVAIYLSRASINAHRREYARAIVDYSKAIEIDRVNPTTWRDRGLAFQALGDFESAIRDTNEAIRLGAGDGRRTLAEVYANRGAAHLRNSEWDLAIADFGEALSNDPDQYPVYLNRGQAFIAKHDFEPALADFTRAIQLNPGAADGYRYREFVQQQLGKRESRH